MFTHRPVCGVGLVLQSQSSGCNNSLRSQCSWYRRLELESSGKPHSQPTDSWFSCDKVLVGMEASWFAKPICMMEQLTGEDSILPSSWGREDGWETILFSIFVIQDQPAPVPVLWIAFSLRTASALCPRDYFCPLQLQFLLLRHSCVRSVIFHRRSWRTSATSPQRGSGNTMWNKPSCCWHKS